MELLLSGVNYTNGKNKLQTRQISSLQLINGKLWLGIGIEIILLISFSMIMYFILTSGNLKQNPFSSRRKGKISLWVAAGLILLAMVLVFQGMINGALFRLF